MFSQCLLADLPVLSLTHIPDRKAFPSNLALHTQCYFTIPDGFALFFLLIKVTTSLCSFLSCEDWGQAWLRCSSLTGLALPPPPAWIIQMSQSNVYETSPWQWVKRHWHCIMEWIRQERNIKRESYYLYTGIIGISRDENPHAKCSLDVLYITFGCS